MPPKRRPSAPSASSKNSTPTVARSTRSTRSEKSTPATSVVPSEKESEEEESEPTKPTKSTRASAKKNTKNANGKRRRSEVEVDSDALDDSDVEVATSAKRAPKKRVVSKEMVIELPKTSGKKVRKTGSPSAAGTSRATRPPIKSRVSVPATPATEDAESPVSDQEEGLEFEDHDEDDEDNSGSEFENSEVSDEEPPEADSDVDIPLASKISKSKPRASRRRAKSLDSDGLDDDEGDEANASEDEALMLEAAIHASLAPTRDVDENGAGPSTSRSTTAPKNARSKAAALRAAAAERRLGIRSDSAEEFELPSDEESYATSDASEELAPKKGSKTKATTEGKKTGVMTLSQMKAARKAKKAADKVEHAPVQAAIRKKAKELKRKLTPAERTAVALLVHHPELEDVWGDLEKKIKPVQPQKADQPEGLKVSLLPFQQESLYWMRKQENGPWCGGMLADEMGMGKTIQTLALFVADRKKPNLVVAPTVALMQWKNEIEAHTEGFKVYMFHGGSREKNTKELAKYDVVLTTYAVLESSFRKQVNGFKRKGEIVKEKSPLHAVTWRRIILDEAHNIKERSTNTAKGAFELKSDYKWCLSGTPLQNRVGELYSLVRFIGGDPFSYYFCKRCPCKSLHWRFADKRGCDDCGHSPMHHTCFWNTEILTPIQKNGMVGPGAIAFKKLRILLDRMMLRRTKVERADDLGLPPRTVIVRRDYFSPEEKEL
ncbi:DNA repair protein rad16, partial [Ceratobasidium sp. 392]